MLRIQWLLVPIVTTFCLSACVTTSSSIACRPDEQYAISDALYFGTDTPDGNVTIDDWQLFLAEVVTPRFPVGLTVWPASGQWRDSSGEIVQENSFVLHLLHPDEPKYDIAIDEVRAIYMQRFQQEAVLRVRTPGCTSLRAAVRPRASATSG